MYNKLVGLAFAIFSLFFGFFISDCEAQSIQLTEPSASLTIPEADDFASVVLRNAWDFNEARDIGWDELFVGSSIVSSDGVWKGTSKGTGAYLFPLFSGFPKNLYPEPIEGDRLLPKYGIIHPIDSSKYTLLSFKLKHSNRSSLAVMWNANTANEYWPNGSQLGSAFDGYFTPRSAVYNPKDSWAVYSYDMKNLAKSFGLVKGAWSGDIVALRLDPSLEAPAESKVELDWMRLVDPTSSPDITIQWKSSDIPAVDNKGTIYQVITVFVDTSSSGYGGVPMKYISDDSDPGFYTFNSGMLPPGTYYFYVQINYLKDYSGMRRSSYSAPVVITAAPSGYFTSPTTVSGEDYATTELGNSWDMSDSSDVSNLPGSSWPDEWRQFANHSFAKGIFQAVANPPLAGNKETDAQVHFNVSASKKIDTSKYRYLTYRIAADDSQYANISAMVEKGFVTRPVFWDMVEYGGETRAHVLYEGYHTYTIDLWKDGIIESGSKWKDNLELSHLRLDPLETNIKNWFFLDWVTLTTENYAKNDSYDIGWVIEGSDGETLSTSLYYDENSVGFDGKLITQLDGLSNGKQSFTWNTSDLQTKKTFYVYAVVSNGTSSRAFYAPAPIKTGEYSKIHPYTVSGTVTVGATPLAGVTISSELGSTTTDSSGVYSYSTVAHNTAYTITPSKAGYTFSPSSATSAGITGNATHNFTATLNTYTVSGTVSFKGEPFAGVVLTCGEATPVTTDNLGQYTLSVASGITCNLKPQKGSYSFIPPEATISAAGEQNFTVNLTQDLDKDGVSDVQEMDDGTNIEDAGDSLPVLRTRLCTEWNGFFGMYNVLEQVGFADVKVSTTLLNNTATPIKPFNLKNGWQYDIPVHKVVGWKRDQYGLICSNISGEGGDLDGRMVYSRYNKEKKKTEFAFALPFLNSRSGAQFVQFNTYQPSLNPAEAKNAVANWIQIHNNSTTKQKGTLFLYGLKGQTLKAIPLTIPKNGIYKVPGHVVGKNAGLARWVPKDSVAEFQIRNQRYMYDSPTYKESFLTALNIDGDVGTGELMVAPIDTRNATSVLELSNVLKLNIQVALKVYTKSKLIYSANLKIPPYASRKIVFNKILNKGQGIVTVDSNTANSLVGNVLQYGRNKSRGLTYAYGVAAKPPVGRTLKGSYNTFLKQGCNLLLLNPTKEGTKAQIKLLHKDIPTSSYAIKIPAYGLLDEDICTQRKTNTSGVIEVKLEKRNRVYSAMLRTGERSNYKFTTPVR